MCNRNGTMVVVVLCLVGCGSQEVRPEPLTHGAKQDGWSSDNSFEVAGKITSTVAHRAVGAYVGLATDPALQRRLAETQVKYMRKPLLAWPIQLVLGQLPHRIDIAKVTVEGQWVTIDYTASVDLVQLGYGASANWYAEYSEPKVAMVPLDPVGVYARLGDRCAQDYGSYILSEAKYYYYFVPTTEMCRIRMRDNNVATHDAKLEIVEVYPQRTVYPEYHLLANRLDARGTVGFAAAILPTLGDDANDRLSGFTQHKDTLENELKLVGAPMEGGRYWRYDYQRSSVGIQIDLFDPTKIPSPLDFTQSFQQALGKYQLVHYSGHSGYGTKKLLSNPLAYAPRYQILVMHACNSNAFYAKQFFDAKAGNPAYGQTAGWATADLLATGLPAYATRSPRVMAILLRGLIEGLAAIEGGGHHQAPSWQELTRMMNGLQEQEGLSLYGGDAFYGVAGSRTNVWQPDAFASIGN